MITIGAIWALAAVMVLATAFKHPGWRMFWAMVLLAQSVYFTFTPQGPTPAPKTTVYLTT